MSPYLSSSLSTVTLTNGQSVTGSVADLSGDGVGSSLSPALLSMERVAYRIPMLTLGSQVDFVMLSSLDCPGQTLVEALNGCTAAQIRLACPSAPLALALTSLSWTSVATISSDAIVPITSQLDSPSATSSSTTTVALHSVGTERLGFSGPAVLDSSRGVANSVIQLLNTSVRQFATSYK